MLFDTRARRRFHQSRNSCKLGRGGGSGRRPVPQSGGRPGRTSCAAKPRFVEGAAFVVNRVTKSTREERKETEKDTAGEKEQRDDE